MSFTQVTSGLISSVANTSITGNIISSQITSVANTQISGLITGGQIATVGTSQLTGQITSSQITNTGVTAGNYGGASVVPVLNINAQGQITSAANVSITSLPSQSSNAGKYLKTDGSTASWSSLPSYIPVANNAGGIVNISVANGYLPVLNYSGSTINVTVT